MEIHVPSSPVPVLTQSDVLVCGAGPAGIAAAVSAARQGCRTVVVERWPSVGGLATNALVNGWHRSDRQKVVINGLVEESARRAERHGWIRRDPKYPYAHETHWFSPEGMRIVWQRMLDEAGVKTLCYLAAGEPLVEDGRIRGVLADTKRGRRALLAEIVIDATGDGDIAAKAGLPFELGRSSDGRVQGMTLMYALRGIDSEVAHAVPPEQLDALVQRMRDLRDRGAFPAFNEGNTRALLSFAVDHHLWNMCPAAGDPLDEAELSRLTAASREKIVAYLDFWREEMPGYAEAEIEQTGFALGIRESRRIAGLKTLNAEMVLEARKQPDAVGHGVWMIDIHDPEGSGYTTYTDRNAATMLPAGESYHIPLGMCLNDDIANLAVVGRCASATHEALASVRVQTHCMVMGQGVGTAAAMSLQRGCDLSEVNIPELQRTLRDDGVYLEDVPGA
ncbi:MAG: FAD-dependent oxidoreductase [Anaerolineae bacterium]